MKKIVIGVLGLAALQVAHEEIVTLLVLLVVMMGVAHWLLKEAEKRD